MSRFERSHDRVQRLIMAWMILIPIIGLIGLAGLGWLVWVLLNHFGVL